MIQIKDVSKLYPAKAAGIPLPQAASNEIPAIHALDHISLHVDAGRVAFDHGAIGVGEIDAGESDRMPRPAERRGDLAGWAECCWDFCWRTEPGSRGEDRIYFPAVPLDSIFDCGGERNARAVLP